MSSDEAMEKLAAAALLGTQRGEIPVIGGGGKLGTVLQALASRPSEERILASAGIASVHARAGGLPRTFRVREDAAPAETLPEVSAASARHLAMMLDDQHGEVLPEYLRLAAVSGRRVSPRQLPALLSLAVRQAGSREAIAAVIGERGRWLVQQREEWKALLAVPEEEHFQTGSAAQRHALLVHLRKQDPAHARTLVASTWQEDKPEDRAAFLQTFAQGLSLEDETFLEAALDDKRKEVREIAADLLARLVGSGLSQRMAGRLRLLVTVTKKLLTKARVTINVPETHDAAMTRDGISEKSQLPKIGDNAFRLAAIVGATPLSFWQDATSMDLAALLGQVESSEWTEAVMWGLATAASRQRDHEAAMRILRHIATVDGDLQRPTRLQVGSLLQLLTPDEREAVVTPWMERRDYAESASLLEFLRHCSHPWSMGFSQAFLPLLWHYVGSDKTNYVTSQAVGTVFGLYAHPTLAGPIAGRIASEALPVSASLEKFLSVLHFRFDIHKEFAL